MKWLLAFSTAILLGIIGVLPLSLAQSTAWSTTSGDSSTSWTSGASWTTKTSPFEVTAPSEVFINEAFDVTVKKLDATGKVDTTFKEVIYFTAPIVEDPDDVVVPLSEDGYQFTAADQWVHAFQKAFTIKKPGKTELWLSDKDDKMQVTFFVTAKEKTGGTTTTADITIDDPASDTTVSNRTLKISGTTKATSSVKILLDGESVKTINSDSSGKYTADISPLKDGENTIKTQVLDGTGKVIGSSEEITVRYSENVPKVTSFVIKEGDKLYTKSSMTFEAIGDPRFKSATVTVGDEDTTLTESASNPGEYVGTSKTGDSEGEYEATLSVESQLGDNASNIKKAAFQTFEGKFEVAKAKSAPEKRIIFLFSLKPDLDIVKYFKIKYGSESEKYTKEVITLSKETITNKDEKEDAKYAWYIPNLENGEYFATITALDKDQKELPVVSEEFQFSILNSAETCLIYKISGIKVNKIDEAHSMITWSPAKEAVSYQVFKLDTSGEFTMVDEVTDTKYRVNIDLTKKQVEYTDFKVRGVCKNGDYKAEGEFSESVAVPTGPEMIVFLLLFIASWIAAILIRRGYLK